MWKKSIFNNVAVNDNFAYIHFPLLYKTNNMLYVEMYSQSAVNFLKLIGIKDKVYNKIVDFLVLELLVREINFIHNSALSKFYDVNFFKITKNKLDIIYSKVPVLIEETENLIANEKELPYRIFKNLFDMFVFLLSVNNLSFIVETLLPDYLMKLKNKELETAYMTNGIFSHMKYFSNEKEKISFNMKYSVTDKKTAADYKDTILKTFLSFSKNIAFLENELGDMTKYEDLEYISGLFNKKINKKDLILSDFKYPKIECNIQEDHLKNYNLIILWAKVLQINLEYRHYWLLRFLRDLRIYYNYNYEIINNWTFNEYAKQNFKIK